MLYSLSESPPAQQLLSLRRRFRRDTRFGSSGAGRAGAEGTGADMITGAGAGVGAAAGACTTMGPEEG